MSFRQRLSLLNVGKTADDVAAEEDRYVQDQKWMDVHMERLDLRHQLWRKKNEHGAERWRKRSNLVREIALQWTESFSREAVIRLGGLMLSFLVFAFAVSLLAYPLKWAWDYVTTPSPPTPVIESPAPRWFYVSYVGNTGTPTYKFWVVRNSSWGSDAYLSPYFTTFEEAQEALAVSLVQYPAAYIEETSTACWQVFEPNQWGKDQPVSTCYAYYEQADAKRAELEQQLRGASGQPATHPLPSDLQSPIPGIGSQQTPPSAPGAEAPETAPEAVAPSEGPPAAPSPAPDQ